MPLLADGIVRFIGEKVAAVAAESEAIAEAAVDLIKAEYEELEPLLDPLEAIKPTTILLHPNVASYQGLLQPIETPSNVFVDMMWRKGDVEAGFRESDVIVENTFTTKPVHQAYIEPHSCVVQAKEAGGAGIWACSKVPFALREQVATAFHKSADEFVVHPCYIGGCFGGKGDFGCAGVLFAFLKSGFQEDGDELFGGSRRNPRHAAIVSQTGAKERWPARGAPDGIYLGQRRLRCFCRWLSRRPKGSGGPYK